MSNIKQSLSNIKAQDVANAVLIGCVVLYSLGYFIRSCK